MLKSTGILSLIGLALALLMSSGRKKQYFEGEIFYTQTVYEYEYLNGSYQKGDAMNETQLHLYYKNGNEYRVATNEEGDTIAIDVLDIGRKQIKYLYDATDTVHFLDLEEYYFGERILAQKDTVVDGEKAYWVKYQSYSTRNYEVYPWERECIYHTKYSVNSDWYIGLNEYNLEALAKKLPYIKTYYKTYRLGKYPFLMETVLDSIKVREIEISPLLDAFGKDNPVKQVKNINY